MFPFWKQERQEACVPACLRAILARYGVFKSETELYKCCQTNRSGTLPSAAVRCIQSLGLDASAVRLADLDELIVIVQREQTAVIVYINLSPIFGINTVHAVIIEALHLESDQVNVFDPDFEPDGRRVWPIGLFEIGWRMARHQVILITPQPEQSS